MPVRCLGVGTTSRRADSEQTGLGSRPGWLARCPGGAQRHHRDFVAAAYGRDRQLGLLIDVLANTGARPSQAVRLRIEDLHDHPVRPKLMMPKSGKGGGRNRSQKKAERYSLPITPALAAKL